MQKNEISFKGQKIFIGIDVHKSTWVVAVLTESGARHIHSQEASAENLCSFLKNNYPEGEYFAVYESGFTGFSTYYQLQALGINCVIAHAADIPSTQYENIMKTDKIDAEKLAHSLRSGDIKPIYIREKENLDDLAVIRVRKTIQKDLTAYKVRIKHMLHCNGVELPERFNKPGQWTKAFITWLKNDVRLLSSTRMALDLLIRQAEGIRAMLLEATRAMRKMGQCDKYKHRVELLMSIPGIGGKISMCLLTEIYDISRFQNERQFASYLGLIPTCHSSGEKIVHGEKTFRGNTMVGPMIVEASWVAIRKDIGLGCAYSNYSKRMTPQEAIIRIARKLSNIIFAVLKTDTAYIPYTWKE